MDDRYIFISDLRTKTYRNLFPAHAPTASNLFKDLSSKFATSGYPRTTFGTSTVTISQLRHSGHMIEILFRLTDPKIPPNQFEDTSTGNLRSETLQKNEEPARSAHMIIDVSAKNDKYRCYPSAIENAELLSRSIIVRYLNTLLGDNFTVPRKRADKGDVKDFSPRLELIAPFDQTIEGLLHNKAVLKEVKVVEQKMASTAHGDASYPVFEKRDLVLQVENRPTGRKAGEMIKGFFAKEANANVSRMKVVLDDVEEGRTKTVAIDLRKTNILENALVRQVRIVGLTPPLKLCEKTPHQQFLQLMASKL